MINPSTTRLPQGRELRIEQVEKGLYTVRNAYEGPVEYFKGRPIPEPVAPAQEKKGD